MSSIKIHEDVELSPVTGVQVNYNIAVPVLVSEEDSTSLDVKEYASVTGFTSDYPNPLAIAWNNGHGEFNYDMKAGVAETGTVKYETDLSYLFAIDMIAKGATVVALPVIVKDAELVEYSHTDAVTAITTTYKVLSYVKAVELVNGIYVENSTSTSLRNMSEFLKNRLATPLRFVTTGGYPNMFNSNKDTRFGVSGIAGMVGVANARQDCAVLGELPEDFMLGATTVEIAEYVSSLEAVESSKRFIGFAPHYTATLAATKAAASKYIINATSTTSVIMPACHAYLTKFMGNVESTASWYAVAGVNRGVIATSAKGVTYNLTQAEARYLRGEGTYGGNYAPVTFNPIIKTRNYGYVIDGNNTGNCSGKQAGQKDFSNFANVRQLLCEINQYCYDTALTVLYEPNDDFAWMDFKASVNALLESMMDNRGIQYYYWKREAGTGLGVLKAVLTVRPIEALEDIDITIKVTDADNTSVTSA